MWPPLGLHSDWGGPAEGRECPMASPASRLPSLTSVDPLSLSLSLSAEAGVCITGEPTAQLGHGERAQLSWSKSSFNDLFKRSINRFLVSFCILLTFQFPLNTFQYSCFLHPLIQIKTRMNLKLNCLPHRDYGQMTTSSTSFNWLSNVWQGMTIVYIWPV